MQAKKLVAKSVAAIPTPETICAEKLIPRIIDQTKKVKEWGLTLFAAIEYK
ncbi:MAG: hypothetical protein P4L74_05645 [Candidatus Doudnabacteria bacterium]|nr:hypothetical protein [Candidatus Doudnabacteria bacterium]